jgi:myo-inositol-hexaphosphate 3-phosphohydrolase
MQPTLICRIAITLSLTIALSACAAPPPAAPQATDTTVELTPAPSTTAEATTASTTPAAVTEPELKADVPVVTATLKTQAVLDMDADTAPQGARLGDVDDPAIWVHPTDPALSLVIGALKEGGLDVYDLDGQVMQSISPEGSRFNNVDLLYGFMLNGQPTDIAVATDRYKDLLAIFKINPETRQLEDVTDPQGKLLFTPEGQASDEETTAYGIALYRDTASGKTYAFVNRRATGDVAQFELTDNDGKIGWSPVRTFTLPTPEGEEADAAQTEGMVVDQEADMLYIGQEDVGVWKISAKPDGGSDATLIHAVAPTGEHLQADVEGLTIYYGPDGAGYLLVSSQGDNTFAVFDRQNDNAYIGSFQIAAEGEVDGADGVQESDGAMVVNVPLGPRFPNGLLVVQDGFNLPAVMMEDEGEMENVSTSFKFIPWERVARAFSPPLLIDTESYAPRGK